MPQPPDVYGEALFGFFQGERDTPLLLHNNYGEIEEMPIDVFFREEEDFPELEWIALSLCDGKILDIGGGAGSHSLYLQERGMDVTALEISAKACELMELRGVRQVVRADIFSYQGPAFDTLLFLMNGIGLAENIDGLKALLAHCKTLLSPGGQLLFDSSDIAYLYEQAPYQGSGYYGEVRYQYEYKGQLGAPFGWLYIDQQCLINLAREGGWIVQIVYEDEQDQYLTRLSLPL